MNLCVAQAAEQIEKPKLIPKKVDLDAHSKKEHSSQQLVLLVEWKPKYHLSQMVSSLFIVKNALMHVSIAFIYH